MLAMAWVYAIGLVTLGAFGMLLLVMWWLGKFSGVYADFQAAGLSLPEEPDDNNPEHEP